MKTCSTAGLIGRPDRARGRALQLSFTHAAAEGRAQPDPAGRSGAAGDRHPGGHRRAAADAIRSDRPEPGRGVPAAVEPRPHSRHRQFRPRRLEPHRVQHAARPPDRPVLGAVSVHVRQPDRHRHRVPGWPARHPVHAHRGRADGVPVPDPGGRDHEHPGSGPEQPVHRRRAGGLDPVRAHHARRDARRAQPRLRAGRAHDRLHDAAHHAAPRPAERDRAGSGVRVHRHGAGDSDRRHAQLPRPGAAAADTRMGRDDRQRPPVPADRVVDHGAARASRCWSSAWRSA